MSRKFFDGPRAGVNTRPAWPGADSTRVPPDSGHGNVGHVGPVDKAAEVDCVDIHRIYSLAHAKFGLNG